MRRLVAIAAASMLGLGALATSGTASPASPAAAAAAADRTTTSRESSGSDADVWIDTLAADTGVVAAFTLIAPTSVARSNLLARAIVPAATGCPRLRFTTASGRHRGRPMTLRTPGATTGAAFANIRACEAPLPGRAVTADVGGTTIPARLPKRVDTLALIGDTGCRIKGTNVQDCANDWPLAQNARSIARADPDAILLVGDYFYREGPCPVGDEALCGGSPAPIPGAPFKDTQAGWLEDAIVPMTPMFAAAPLLMLRGNHEACDRGGNGFFLFFDVSPLGADACAPVGGVAPTNITPSWRVDLPVVGGRDLRLVAVDSAYGTDYPTVSPWALTQASEFERAERLASRGPSSTETWMLSHRPVFGLVTDQFSTGPTWTPWGSMDQEAAAEGLLDPYDALVSSHIHVAQAVETPGYPAQLVIGNGGTALDPTTGYAIPAFGPLLDGAGSPISPSYTPYPNATYQWTDVRFGHVIATPAAREGRWVFEQRAPDGTPFATCTLRGRAIGCSS